MPRPDLDPIDRLGHGTHVAGIAAGRSVGALGGGIAPEADLYAIKVSGGRSGPLTSVAEEAIEWVLDPNQDFDLSDRLDVINMSFGSAFGDQNSPWVKAVENAVAMGVIVTTSAGNSGNSPYILGGPGISLGAISVAAASAGDVPFVPIEAAELNGAKAYIVPTGHSLTVPIVGETVFQSGQDCEISNEVNDKIVYVPRRLRRCLHSDFAAVLKQQNAKAILVTGSMDYRAVLPQAQEAMVPIFVTLIDAEDIPASLALRLDKIELGRSSIPLASFSSRGPHLQYFKPEVAAPGLSIVAPLNDSGFLGITRSGTSMAAPLVVGAMALLKSVHPDWSVEKLKALLMNNADPIRNTEGRLLPLSRQGVGEINIERSIQAQSVAIPGGLNFGYAGLGEFKRVERQMALHNHTGQGRLYHLDVIKGQNLPGVHFDYPGSVWVAANSSSTFNVSLHFNPFEMLTLFDSSWYEFDALIELSTSGQEPIRVGVQAVLDPVADVEIIASDNASSTIYNHSQVSATVSSFIKLESQVIRGAESPLFGGQFVEKGGDTFLQFAMAINGPWASPLSVLSQLSLNIDTDNSRGFEFRVEFNARLPRVRLRNLSTNQVLAESHVLADFNSRVFSFELPVTGTFEHIQQGRIDVAGRFSSNGRLNVSRILLDEIPFAENMPYNELIAPFNEWVSPIPSGREIFWFVPQAVIENEVLD